MRRAIGGDLGGSHVMAAVVEEDGTIKHRHEVDIVDHQLDAVLKAMRKAITGALDRVGTPPTAGTGEDRPGTSMRRPGRFDIRRTSTGRTFRWASACAPCSTTPSTSRTTHAARRSANIPTASGRGRETSSS